MKEASDRGDAETERQPLLRRLAEQLRLFLVLFLYLWVLLGLFVLNQDLVHRQQGSTLALQGFAIVNALILAKVMLVIEDLNFARWVSGRPAILTILFEASLCTALFLAFHVVERLVIHLFKGSDGSEPILSIGGGGWLGLAIVAVMLFVSLLPFFAFKNVMRIIGPDRMRQILLERQSVSSRDPGKGEFPRPA